MSLEQSGKIIFFCVCAVLFSIGICLAQGNAPFDGEISENDINIRSDSTTSSQVICAMNKGERVDVVLELYEWYKINLPRKAPAYVKKSLTECIKRSEEPLSLCLTAKIIKDNVNIRLAPGEGSPIIGRAGNNEIVNILKENDGWYKIEPIQNSFGWVHKKFVKKAANKITDIPSPEKITAPVAYQETKNSNMIIIEGTVRPYGMVFRRKETHKLVLPDERIFLLKGNKKSLDALNYKKVKITGRLLDSAAKKYPTIEISATEVIN